jgi:RNA polymerase sigma-70 factor (ECF subfamily)
MVAVRDWLTAPDPDLMGVLAAEGAAAEDKQKACEVLVTRHYHAMLRRARGELPQPLLDLARDVVQEVVAVLLKSAKARQFDPARPLGPWLLQVVTYKARDVRRQESRHRATGDCPCRAPGRDADLALDDYLAELLGHLTGSEEEVVRLFYLDGLSARDVAERKDWSLDKVYRELHKARTKLRSLPGP